MKSQLAILISATLLYSPHALAMPGGSHDPNGATEYNPPVGSAPEVGYDLGEISDRNRPTAPESQPKSKGLSESEEEKKEKASKKLLEDLKGADFDLDKFLKEEGIEDKGSEGEAKLAKKFSRDAVKAIREKQAEKDLKSAKGWTNLQLIKKNQKTDGSEYDTALLKKAKELLSNKDTKTAAEAMARAVSKDLIEEAAWLSAVEGLASKPNRSPEEDKELAKLISGRLRAVKKDQIPALQKAFKSLPEDSALRITMSEALEGMQSSGPQGKLTGETSQFKSAFKEAWQGELKVKKEFGDALNKAFNKDGTGNEEAILKLQKDFGLSSNKDWAISTGNEKVVYAAFAEKQSVGARSEEETFFGTKITQSANLSDIADGKELGSRTVFTGNLKDTAYFLKKAQELEKKNTSSPAANQNGSLVAKYVQLHINDSLDQGSMPNGPLVVEKPVAYKQFLKENPGQAKTFDQFFTEFASKGYGQGMKPDSSDRVVQAVQRISRDPAKLSYLFHEAKYGKYSAMYRPCLSCNLAHYYNEWTAELEAQR